MTAAQLRSLHQRGQPLILANVWDAATARAVVDAGFEAVATSSAAVAASLGYEDHEGMPAEDAVAAIERIARAVPDTPVTADFEAGYGLAAVELVDHLLTAGAVGCNLEDSDHTAGGLRSADLQAASIDAVRAAAGEDLVINARIDTYLAGEEDPLVETIRRAQLYLDAGADCVYPVGMSTEDDISAFVREIAAPVNILVHRAAPSVTHLAELGVARVSYGAGIFRRAMRAVTDIIGEIERPHDCFVVPDQ